ncbi:hypothetical protein SAMN06265795_12225 [Noviherbaspirillum humi]|uniref:Phage regulatory protein CII (CP76) n=1 Tax=Noviherbaspirillum humi TaxID=1688639 RepID=A0A239LDK8_9BURK|nr:YmfL family putative regulatory protein [Noviherbaspirillum humi]SNT28726.1 hypothetical protein SAMN06265795_12225 [Noviherbaspirillum humi]
MELRKAYQTMIKAFAGGWDAMAAALGTSKDSLENRIYERKGQSMLVEIALQMQSFSDTTHFAEAIATISGGTFVKLPNVDHVDNDDILAKMNQLHVELGQWCGKFALATADGEIDTRERADLSAVVDAMHRTLDEIKALTFRAYCRDTDTVLLRSKE